MTQIILKSDLLSSVRMEILVYFHSCDLEN